MNESVLALFALQDQIFGVCPCCCEVFRLSDCTLFRGAAPAWTWLDKIEQEEASLDALEEKIDLQLDQLREAARKAGRKRAQAIVTKIDRIFAPKRLHADDAKPLCHPVDYIVFDGLNASTEVKRIVLLDREAGQTPRAEVQASIKRAIKNGNVQWRELHVSDSAVVSARSIRRAIRADR